VAFNLSIAHKPPGTAVRSSLDVDVQQRSFKYFPTPSTPLGVLHKVCQHKIMAHEKMMVWCSGLGSGETIIFE
jgi:hypothetical protein